MILVLSGIRLSATMPPFLGGGFPDLIQAQMDERPDRLAFQAALLSLPKRLLQNRFDSFGNRFFERPTGPYLLKGIRTVPVLMVNFSNSPAPPFGPADLQTALFDGPSPTGTVADYYHAISYGNFRMTGQTLGLVKLSKPQTDYAGPAGCYGMCAASPIADMVLEALAAGGSFDWTPFDNDGPDGAPNSIDDDGFVDFVVIVHPGQGGECRGNQNLWSHQGSLTGWNRPSFQTTTPASRGGFLRVNDYVIVPSLSCLDAKAMIEIGVWVHEFGHALGLPDLYSTNKTFPSPVTGNWCVMGTGSWGGDGKSPARPTHMSAWAKGFLGWMTPQLVASPQPGVVFNPAETVPSSYTAAIGGGVYYLAERRDRSGFDANLPAAGLLVWRVDEAVVAAGLSRNQVNYDLSKPGIRLVEADGGADLLTGKNAGDPTDVFSGTPVTSKFDATTRAKAEGGFALCGIQPGGTKADIGVGGPCPFPSVALVPAPPKAPGAVILGSPDDRGAGPGQGAVVPEAQPVSGLTVASLVRTPAEFIDRAMMLTGRLDNAGTNYFTDRRIVLFDANGVNGLPVRGAVGVTEAISTPRAGDAPAAALSDYLGQQVVVAGRLQRVLQPDGSVALAFVIDTIRRR